MEFKLGSALATNTEYDQKIWKLLLNSSKISKASKTFYGL